jgi:hypothetical protein
MTAGVVTLREKNANRKCTCGEPATAYVQGEGFRCGDCHPEAVAERPASEKVALDVSYSSRESEPEPVGAGEERVGAWSEELDVSIYADTSLTLPGMDKPGQNCGEAIPIEYCEDCGEPHFSTVSCNQRQCPDCWRTWASDRSEGVVRRLAAARRVTGEGVERRALHVAVSPPEGEVRSLSDVNRMMKRAYELVREKGMRGGVAIPHGWRVTDTARSEWRAATNGGEDGPSLWAWVRQEYGEGWRMAVYWSPHVHVIGVAPEFGEDKPAEQDGWVVRRIRSLSEWSLTDREGYEDMARVSQYLLSHAAYEPESNTDTVRWFGELHPSNFSPDPASGEIQNPALESLSEGVYKVVSRYAKEAVGEEVEPGEDPERTCRREGCEGRRDTIHNAGDRLMSAEWCEQIPDEQETRLKTALEWLRGDVLPPPGMKNPQTPEQAREVLGVLVGT